MIFVNIGILKMLVLGMNHIFAYGCHDLMQISMRFNNVTIAYVKRSVFRTHFCYMSKDDAINIMNGSNLVGKMGVS